MPDSRTYVAPAALGLGDLVVALPIIQTLIERGHNTWLVVRAEAHIALAERIAGLRGCRTEWELPSVEEMRANGDRFFDLRDHELQRQYWWGSQEFEHDYPGYLINDILHTICGDKGITDVNFHRLLPLRYNKVKDLPATKVKKWKELEQTVLLIPGSAVNAKTWSRHRWLELVGMLKTAGVPLAIIGEPWNSPLVHSLSHGGLPCLPTPTIGDAIDAISNCRAVISVDTGLMHLAVQQGIPTVGLYRHAPVYVREQPHFVPLTARKPCQSECFKRQQKCAHHNVRKAGPGFQPANWDCAESSGQRCIDSISAERVLSGLEILMYVRNQPTSPQRTRHRRFSGPARISLTI
jgi:hypothetical protein